MKFLAVHPGPLMYTKIYLRLEPLGLEMVAQAARQAGHDVRLIDLQVETWKDYLALIRTWKPDVVAFCVQLPGECTGNRGSREVDQEGITARLCLRGRA